jgi:hypothetical protein
MVLMQDMLKDNNDFLNSQNKIVIEKPEKD